MYLSQEAINTLTGKGAFDLFSAPSGNIAIAVLNYIQQSENPELSEFVKWCFEDTIRRVLENDNHCEGVVLRTVLSYLCKHPTFLCLYYADMELKYQCTRLEGYLARSQEQGLFDTIKDDYQSRKLEAMRNDNELEEHIVVLGLNLIQDEDGEHWDWVWDFVKPIVSVYKNPATGKEEPLTKGI